MSTNPLVLDLERAPERDDRCGLERAATNPHRTGPVDTRDPHDRAFDRCWPLRGAEALRLLLAAVAVAGTGILVGFTLTDWTAPNAVTRFDTRVAEWFEAGRTDALNSFSHVAAFPADTIPKIAISVLICGFFLWRWRRWDEAVFVALPLVFEALCFITITRTVQRPRPEVEHVIHSTIDSSFPSGHVAAATVYVAVVIVVFRHTTAVWARLLAAGLFVTILTGVIWARLYQGVHFVSDVTAGVVLGVVSVAIADRVLRRRAAVDGRST